MKKLVLKNYVWAYRRKYGLTQSQLAYVCGTTRETISSIERNKYNPSLKLAMIIAIALEVSVDDIFYFDEVLI